MIYYCYLENIFSLIILSVQKRNLYNVMICVSSLDDHSVLCTFQTHDMFLLDQHLSNIAYLLRGVSVTPF